MRGREPGKVWTSGMPPQSDEGYFGSLWSGRVPLVRVFWGDMMVGGTLINLAAMFLSLILLAGDVPGWLASVVYFSPIPLNVFLALAVWRSALPARIPWAWPARGAALLWLAAMIVV